MPINIKNREAEHLLNTLAKKAHRGKSQLVLELLRREADRQTRLDNLGARRKQVAALSRRSARRIGRSAPSPDEILGYDSNGRSR